MTDMTSSNSMIKKQPVEEVINLSHYFKIINQFKWRIFFLATAVAILTLIIVKNITPTFQATSTLLIEANQAKAVSFEEVMGLDSNRKEYYLTQFEILKSNTIAGAVITQLNLQDEAEFQPQQGESVMDMLRDVLPFLPTDVAEVLTEQELEERKLRALIRQFSEQLTIQPIRKTQLVSISFDSQDPRLAAKVANAVGDVYIQQDLFDKISVNESASGWLHSRLSDLRVTLDKSEAKLQAYSNKENLISQSGEGVSALISKELDQTSQQLTQARNEYNQLRSIVALVKEQGTKDLALLESMPEISSHPAIVSLRDNQIEVELKISDLSKVYGPKHPTFKSAQSEWNTVTKRMKSRILKIVSGLDKSLTTKKRNIKALERDLASIKAKYHRVLSKENIYRKLRREVNTNRKIFDTFLSRSKETEVTSDFNSAVARFTDRAFAPERPIKPKKALIVLLAFVATFGLGIVAAFVFESLNDNFKSAKDIEDKLSFRMLGLLPLVELKKHQDLGLHHFFTDTGRRFAESVRTLRTSYILTHHEDDKVIAITSSVPGEGKSTTSVNLAFSLGQMGKVLLIDGDMRKPSICKRFSIPNYHAGLSNMIAQTEVLDDCLYHDDQSNITVMPCGNLPSNPQELLASKHFEQLITQLKESYDYIIIDTPPINAVSDALIIAKQADSLMYVVKSDDTRTGVVRNGVGRLVDANIKIAGIVLNKVDIRASANSDYYYGYYSDKAYGSAVKTNTSASNDILTDKADPEDKLQLSS
ncbi:polysaccharide biosynthesis tyrosine autokinase [Moritella sp.]|uniref:GumC family protein n=1 Tax=Moritella sp. TaxID=78556 RepID=UPI001D9F0102|nr:polysaccharide biosynthesis tyrosine autokinase [Moritella sp.]MCJ8349705.1 polysaccharide biosynthesis tyrosine autokinase [Moritella sp.]NQZ39880.1 polysaccharide biosynthesis tyrosine autokinase [Moritella sp.]